MVTCVQRRGSGKQTGTPEPPSLCCKASPVMDLRKTKQDSLRFPKGLISTEGQKLPQASRIRSKASPQSPQA